MRMRTWCQRMTASWGTSRLEVLAEVAEGGAEAREEGGGGAALVQAGSSSSGARSSHKLRLRSSLLPCASMAGTLGG